MACPICDKTLIPLGCCLITDQPIHWCCVCGFILPKDGDAIEPLLIGRCRKFEEILANAHRGPAADVVLQILRSEWHRLGIAEAIHPPEERKL